MSSAKIAIFFIVLQLTQIICCSAECRCEKQDATSASDLLTYGVKTAALAGVAMVGLPAVISAVGFGAGGVALGSAAAGVQSAWFGGTIGGFTGAVFSSLQSIGAAGMGLLGKTAVIRYSGVAVKVYDAVTGEECNC